jgi:pimeloyl-ACP methyl ester carboxylesterase
VRRVIGDGVELAVQDEGDGPPVLLIHGFPDSSRLWRHQVPALTAVGHRVVVPDLRGFGDSGKPAEVEAYGLPHAVADMVAVLDALGLERAAVVGHDWGAMVAWMLATAAPERVERLAVLSVGHPAAMRRTIEDREKAWYMLLFQFEGVAEELLRRHDWALLREWLDGEGDLEHYLADLERPGALTAGLNWYRANVHPERELRPRRPLPPVRVPTLGIWSTGDRYLTEERMRRSGDRVDAPFRYERIEGVSHWIPLDAPERLNALLTDYLA